MSLIAGLEYGTDGGMENGMGWGMWLTHVTGAFVQGCASYYVSRALISLQRLYEQCHG